MPNRALTRRRIITIAAAAAAQSLLPGAAPAAGIEPQRWRGSAMGAQVSIDIHHPDRGEAAAVIARCVAEVRRLERQFSLYQPDSAICALNRAGVLIAPDADMVALLRTARGFADLTDGAFDPTVQPLWRLYATHFSARDADPAGPAAERLADALGLVGYRQLQVSEDRIALTRPGAAITLNGIAQGFVTDRVVEQLRRAGLGCALVDLGEIRALGARPDGTPWRVGSVDGETVAGLPPLELVDRAVATSAGTGFRFDAAGRFTHLFDPATGTSPALYRAVSVVAATATAADALSTAFSLMPQPQIAAIVATRRDLRVRLIGRDGTVESLPA